MQSASLRQNFQKWIPDERLLQLALGHREIELCQVATVEMANQVRSTEMHNVVRYQHKTVLPMRGRLFLY
jgi:hypothetical protein